MVYGRCLIETVSQSVPRNREKRTRLCRFRHSHRTGIALRFFVFLFCHWFCFCPPPPLPPYRKETDGKYGVSHGYRRTRSRQQNFNRPWTTYTTAMRRCTIIMCTVYIRCKNVNIIILLYLCEVSLLHTRTHMHTYTRHVIFKPSTSPRTDTRTVFQQNIINF